MDKKALSLPILISLVVGNMVGTGIYMLPASLAQYGTIALLAWVLTAAGALLLAITFVNLNKRFPKTGGPYAFCKAAFGRIGGFIVAYVYWSSNMISIAGIAVASIGYLGFIWPALNAGSTAYHPLLVLVAELAIVWLFTLVNIFGIHGAGIVQLFLTIMKMLPLLAVSLIGLAYIHPANFSHAASGNISYFAALSSAATLTFWAFIGLETATIPAENTLGPKDISRATIYGVIISSLIYFLSTFVLMGMIPMEHLKNSQFPFAEAGTLLFGSGAATVIALFALISGLGTLNASILVQGEIVFAAARDHLFPHRFAKLSRHDAPVAGQLLSSSLVSVFLMLTIAPTLLKQFNTLALLAGLLTLVIYLATTLAEIKFTLDKKIAFTKLFYGKAFVIAILASGYCLWMISSFDSSMIVVSAVIILLCIPIYKFTLKKLPA